jgi:hypothetical protein
MKVTDEMVETVCVSYFEGHHTYANRDAMKAALEAALAPFAVPPFVPAACAVRAMDMLLNRTGLDADVISALSVVACEWERAQKTLGVAQAAPVSDYQRGRQEVWEEFSRAADCHGIVHEETGERLWVSKRAAPVGDLLTVEERFLVSRVRDPAGSTGLIAIIDRLAPCPAPVVKTPGQVLCEAQGCGSWENADKSWYERAAAAVLAAHGAAK